MIGVLKSVARNEHLDVPEQAYKQIVEDANGNMRKALLVMEALRMQS
jgi:replication factor C subunit 3/5